VKMVLLYSPKLSTSVAIMNYSAICMDVDIYGPVIRCGFTEELSITAQRARERCKEIKGMKMSKGTRG